MTWIGIAEHAAGTITMATALLLIATPALHPLREAQINTINAAGTTWTAKAHARFANDAPGASQPMLGINSDWAKDIRDAIERNELTRYKPQQRLAVPDSWDAADAFPQCAKIIGDIRDQSNCG